MILSRFLIGCLALSGVACSGAVGGDGDAAVDPAENAAGAGGAAVDPPVAAGPTIDGATPEEVLASSACSAPAPGSAPLRRLSNAEYRNTVVELLGHGDAVQTATSNFVSETESLGFRNNAQFLGVPTLIAQQYMDAAEQIAEAVRDDAGLLPCTPEAGAEATCATEFIRDFGSRAYRRPLGEAEIASFDSIYAAGAVEGGFETGIEWVVFSMLQSPQFLYRVELAEPEAGSASVPVTGYEMASRLSYLLLQSMPDAELFAAAEAGELTTPEQIETQARRLLDDPKSGRVLEFFEQWLDIDQLASLDRDPAVFPDLAANLPELLREETRAFVASLLESSNGSFQELLTAPYTFVNPALAEHYGLPAPSGTGFELSPAPERSGILTQGMLLAHDKPTRTSIVNRGKKIRLDLFCQIVPAPPNNVVIDLEGIGEGLSQRERLAQHRSDPVCASCHRLLDPIGVVFEGFDAVGRPRSYDETGEPIDPASELTDTRDADGPITGVRDLAERLAQSNEVRECYARQSFRFFYGRELEDADRCSEAQLLSRFRDSGYNLRELLVALTQTDAFRFRPAN